MFHAAMKMLFLLICAFFPQACDARPVNEGVFAPSRLNSVLGQDGVTPIPVKLRGGMEIYLWTFGDTMLGGWTGPVLTTATLNFNSFADIKSMPCNTLAVSSVPTAENYRYLDMRFHAPGGKVSEFIGYRKGEDPFVKRMWADDGIQLKEWVYVYYMDVALDKSAPGSFAFRGTGLARARVPEKADPDLFAFERLDGFSAEGVVIGDSVIRKGRYLYVLGRLSRKNDGNLTSLAFMRVKPGDIADLKRYEFLSQGGEWGRERGAFMEDVAGEASLVYDERKGVFRLTWMSFAAQEIMTAEFSDFRDFALKPGGMALYKPPAKKDVLYYSAKEIFSEAGRRYIIYIDPSIYQPILVTVPASAVQAP